MDKQEFRDRFGLSELDRRVAMEVMRWYPVEDRECKGRFYWLTAEGKGTGYTARCVPNECCEHFEPSTNMAHAWDVVEELHRRGDCLSLEYVRSLYGMQWEARFRIAEVWASAISAPEAVCKAALEAVKHGA